MTAMSCAAKVESQVRRMKKAERERPNLLAQTVYIGTLGLLLVLPVVSGYSIRWTMSMLFLGVVVGGLNVYLFIRDK